MLPGSATPEQQQWWLRLIADRSMIGVLLLSEPERESDAAALIVTARRAPGGHGSRVIRAAFDDLGSRSIRRTSVRCADLVLTRRLPGRQDVP